ncbi:MAG: hypothetical protein AAGD14_09220 [Planctomycetota bacterium]
MNPREADGARDPIGCANTTLARRLLVGIYKVLLTGEVFDLERCLRIA